MKIICVGRNYSEHISELDNEKPDSPVIFLKPETSLLTQNKDFFIPNFSNDIHYEVEILVKISKEGKSIAPQHVQNYYEEIGLGVDFTARDIQKKLKEKGLPWERAKAFNHSAVVSHFLPKDSFDLQNLPFSLEVNSQKVQKGNTRMMLWNIDELILDISQFIHLKKGDIIFTGTPKGVGKIAIGDVLTGFIENNKMFEFKIK